MPRHPDPDLEPRILEAASRLWARGGEKALTMRAVAKAAGTTTPTVYERYRDREGILRALRLQTRSELFATLKRTRTLRQSVERYIGYALEHTFAYEVLFDGVGKPPSLNEPWPSFNLMRERVAEQLGGPVHDYSRIMLSLWSLMHGTAMLIIRGRFEGALRTQTVNACLEAMEAILSDAARQKRMGISGPKWPPNLILGEGKQSRVGDGNHKAQQKGKKPHR